MNELSMIACVVSTLAMFISENKHMIRLYAIFAILNGMFSGVNL